MIESSKQKIKFNQLLHGYKEGHKLIAGSLSLKSQSAKTVLSLSDLSAQGFSLTNDSYLTGYPLQDIGMYAIAKTWLASEMPRPGCVWTHTILIDFSDLALISDTSLLSLFKRPDNLEDFSKYSSVLEYIPTLCIDDTSIDIDAARNISLALYEQPNNRIFYQTNYEIDPACLTLKIWLQQWPRLRRTFRFCTFSPVDRSINRELFDLQFTPNKMIFFDKKDHLGPTTIIGLFEKIRYFGPDWAELVIDDLLFNHSASEFRKFLWRYGAESDLGRGAVRPLTLIWKLINNSNEYEIISGLNALSELNPPVPGLVKKALEILIDLYLNDNSAQDLKIITYLGEHIELLDNLSPTQTLNVVEALLPNANQYLFPLFKTNKQSLRLIAKTAVELMSDDKLISNLKEDSTRISDFLDAKPKLIFESSIWEIEGVWNVLLDYLENLPSNQKAIFKLLISINNLSLLKIVHEKFGTKLIFEAIRVLDEDDHTLSSSAKSCIKFEVGISECWVKYISSNQINRLETLSFLASISDFRRPPFSLKDEWLSGIENLKQKNFYSTYFCSFIFARAITGISKNTVQLLKFSFDNLHIALVESKIDQESWLILDHMLPRVNWWEEWDQALRLRIALVDAFLKFDLSAECFVDITQSEKIFDNLVDIMFNSIKGKKYLKRIDTYHRGKNAARYKIIRHKLNFLSNFF